MARFLALDLGAESGRGIVAELSADRVALREVHRFATHHGRLRGVLQWNLLGLWEEIKTALRKAGDGGQQLDGIGADTWGVDFGLLDVHGNILGNPVHYRDARTDGVMDRVSAQIGRERLYGLTGIQFLFFNTLFQLGAEKDGGFSPAACRLLFIPDLLHYLLSGNAVNELTIASTSALLDPHSKQWSQPLLAELGLPAVWLGEIVPPGTRVGGLLTDVASETGLRGGTPIIAPASHDTASAVAAVPAEGSDWAYISSGTWSLLGAEIDAPVLSPDALRLNFTNELGAGNKVRLLKNIMGLWLVQETRRDLARRGTDLDYPELTRLAAAEAGLDLLMSSWHEPFARPGDFLRKIESYAAMTEQPAPRTPGGYVRACLDSLALSYRSTLDELEIVTGRRFKTLHIVGGGSKNELLNQMTADATGRTVLAGPVEATALGNALTQAIGASVIGSLEEGRRLIGRSFEVKVFKPRDTDRYERVLPRWKQLLTVRTAS